jgi:hypothetical protein
VTFLRWLLALFSRDTDPDAMINAHEHLADRARG